MKKSELRKIIKEELQKLNEEISVKNVGDAKSLLRKNKIKVLNHRYTDNKGGFISTDNDSEALFLVRSMGLWRPN